MTALQRTSLDNLRALVLEEIITSGMRQYDICHKAGITAKHLSSFLNGHSGMSLELVDTILAVMGRGLVLSTRVDLAARVSNKNAEIKSEQKEGKE